MGLIPEHTNEDILMKAYYKDLKNKLHQINAFAPIDQIVYIREQVINQLFKQMESYKKPVLVLIQGGKA